MQSGAVVACMAHAHEVTGSNPVSAPIRNVYQSSDHVVKMNFETCRFVIYVSVIKLLNAAASYRECLPV